MNELPPYPTPRSRIATIARYRSDLLCERIKFFCGATVVLIAALAIVQRHSLSLTVTATWVVVSAVLLGTSLMASRRTSTASAGDTPTQTPLSATCVGATAFAFGLSSLFVVLHAPFAQQALCAALVGCYGLVLLAVTAGGLHLSITALSLLLGPVAAGLSADSDPTARTLGAVLMLEWALMIAIAWQAGRATTHNLRRRIETEELTGVILRLQNRIHDIEEGATPSQSALRTVRGG